MGWRHMAKKIIVFIIVIVILFILFLPGYTKLQDLIIKNKELEARILELRKSVADLTVEKEKLETDLTYIEKIAREKLGLIKEGEKIIEIEK